MFVKRFRISTLLIFTALCAGAFVVLRPFDPQVRIYDPVDLDRYHGYYHGAKIYEFSVVNAGGHAIWLPDNSEPFASSAIGHFVGGVRTNRVFVWAEERGFEQVQPGEGLVYQICMSESDADFEVVIEVQDWRGRSQRIDDRVYVLNPSEAHESSAL